MGGFVRTLTGSRAAKASGRAAAGQARGIERAAELQAESQREALDYLKAREALPQEFREGALSQIGGLYGLGDVSGQEVMASLQASPIYGAITGQRQAGEDAILRNAAATGGLRSGNVQDALARYSGDLENQALMQSLSGLQGLAALPSNANQIAGAIGGIGQTLGQGVAGAAQTLAQGKIAGAQAQQAGTMGLLNAAVSGASAAAGAGAFGGSGAAGGAGSYMNMAGGSYSDSRLKSNVRPMGEKNGHKWYAWDWNKDAEDLGLIGPDEGVMAHEVMQTNPEAVAVRDGYLAVDYAALGVQ